jgi:hypothetical protein
MLRKAKQYNFFTKIYNKIVDEINSLWGRVERINDKINNIKPIEVWWENINKSSSDISVYTNYNSHIYINNNTLSFNKNQSNISIGKMTYGYNFNGVQIKSNQLAFIFTNDSDNIIIRYNNSSINYLFNKEFINANFNLISAYKDFINQYSYLFTADDFQTLRTIIDNYNSQNT